MIPGRITTDLLTGERGSADGWDPRSTVAAGTELLARRAGAHFDEAGAIARGALCARCVTTHAHLHPAPVGACPFCPLAGGTR